MSQEFKNGIEKSKYCFDHEFKSRLAYLNLNVVVVVVVVVVLRGVFFKTKKKQIKIF